MARETWTDERLDDLKEDMNRRFDEVYRRFDEVDRRFDRVEAEIARLHDRFDALERTLIAGFLAIVAAIIATGAF